jgi:hypothetical protein
MREQFNHLPIQEILRPDVTPEMGFQSYEMLADIDDARKGQQQAFLESKVINPVLSYPQIHEHTLNQGIRTLNTIGLLSEEITDENVSSAIWNSAGYRLAEMYWLKQAKKLDEARHDPDSERFVLNAERYQAMNEELYGKPDAEITANIIGEVFAQAEEKQLDEVGARILEELKNGTQVTVAGEVVQTRGLAGLEKGRLPEIKDRLTVLTEVIQEEFAPVYELVNNYWEQVIVPRERTEDEQAQFETTDMVELFTKMRDQMDPENRANISVILLDKASSLAWDTPSMSVRVGANRKAITTKEEMTGHLIHELGIHGGRAVEGLKTDLPILGTGLFTDAQEGEQSDYLTFEEGFASLINTVLENKAAAWQSLHVSHYLNTALAYVGADFREAFELTWRARVLMAVPNGKPVTEAIIQKQREQAYVSMVRTRRGTPTEVAHNQPITFNKDLAYLQGKIIALQFLDKVGTDKAAIRQVLKGKFDPLNSAQKQLADMYIPA